MQYKITKNDDPFHLRITGTGTASGVRFQWIFTEVANFAATLDNPPILLDERTSRLENMDALDVMLSYNFLLEKNHILAGSRLAILLNPGRDYDFLSGFRHLAKTGLQLKVEAFDDEEAALAWLQEPKTTA
jgi:hypothetical protein